MHLGHAFAALHAWHLAREQNGKFLLRIENIDTGRCRQEFEEAIFEDLLWLGLNWDGQARKQSHARLGQGRQQNEAQIIFTTETKDASY